MINLGAIWPWPRRLARAARRVALCLAFVLQPIAAHAAAQAHSHQTPALSHHQDGGAEQVPPAEGGDTTLSCHHSASCQAFVLDPGVGLPVQHGPTTMRAARVAAPPSAIAPRLFRPPRSTLPA
jgi:hypothetical protein